MKTYTFVKYTKIDFIDKAMSLNTYYFVYNNPGSKSSNNFITKPRKWGERTFFGVDLNYLKNKEIKQFKIK